MKLTDLLSPITRPFGLSGPKQVFNGIKFRPGKLSGVKTDIQNVVLRPRTLNRPSSSSREQKRDYITGGLSVEDNLLNLDKFNLIGVFGPPEDREALVLSPRGKITRLKVGSRFQRGRVISIGKDQVVYIRDNKNYVFRMKN